MKNIDIVNSLDTLADYYTLAKDPPRVRAFRNAARNIELISFEIDSSNIDNVDFKGLGKSIKSSIQELVKTSKIARLEELKIKLPPVQALQLIQLYNFDLEYVFYLWDKYKAFSLPHLYALRALEPRARYAIDMFSSLDLSYNKLAPATYPLLGDLAVQSSFGLGVHTIDEICVSLKQRDYKHGFIADFCEGPNTLSKLSKSQILLQKQAIKDAQLKHDIRIWQGLIIDVDLEGNVPTELTSLVDYVIIKLSTRPHENVFNRITSAATKLPGAFIDVLDKYTSTNLTSKQLLDLASKNPLVIHTPDYITTSRILDLLTPLPAFQAALVSYATNEHQLDNIFLAQDLAHKLLYQPSSLINCRSHPFKSSSTYTSTTGIKGDTPQDSLQKFEATLQRMRQLQNTNLKQLFQKDSK